MCIAGGWVAAAGDVCQLAKHKPSTNLKGKQTAKHKLKGETDRKTQAQRGNRKAQL